MPIPPPLTLKKFALSNRFSTVSGAGDITITELFSWTSGTLSGAGAVQIAAAAMLSIDSNATLERRLDNTGTVVLTGQGGIDLGPGTVFNNSGTFIARNDGTVGRFCCTRESPATFNNTNTGTFRKEAGNGRTTFDLGFFGGVMFNNSGTVEVRTGTLALGGTTTIDGRITATNAGMVEVASGDLRFDGAYMQISGLADLAGGALTPRGGLIVQGGALTGSGTATGNVTNAGLVALLIVFSVFTAKKRSHGRE